MQFFPAFERDRSTTTISPASQLTVPFQQHLLTNESKLGVDGLGDVAARRKDGHGGYDPTNDRVSRPVQGELHLRLNETGFSIVTIPLRRD